MKKKLLDVIRYGKVEQDVSLSKMCTFGIGGKADYVVYPADIEELYKVIQKVEQLGIKYFILGKGSNVLFADNGFRGVVIVIGQPFSRIEVDEDLVSVESGCTLSTLCKTVQQHGLSGMEGLYGIPGTVGGGLRMNCGAFGAEIADYLVGVTYLDGGKFCYRKKADCGFEYRKSIFQEHPNWIIVRAEFRLPKGDENKIKEKMDAFMQQRIDRQDLTHPSAGSVFRKNPQLNHPVSYLIDQMGLKGCTIGGAKISEKHAGFLINFCSASSQNVLDLIQYIQERFLQVHHVHLMPEIVIVEE